MAHTEAEQETARVRLDERPPPVRHRGRVARPNVGDTAGDHEAVARGEQQTCVSEDLFAPQRLGDPQGLQYETFELAHIIARLARGDPLDVGRPSTDQTKTIGPRAGLT